MFKAAAGLHKNASNSKVKQLEIGTQQHLLSRYRMLQQLSLQLRLNPVTDEQHFDAPQNSQ